MSSSPSPTQPLKGFRDFLPDLQKKRQWIIHTFSTKAKNLGFQEMDTPTLEYQHTLFQKAGTDVEKQSYLFEDSGGRKVGLRFDLTVPLVRFIKNHRASLEFPFARFQIGKVYRGENAQRGRFREFIQMDCDILGGSLIPSSATLFIFMCRSLQALGLNEFQIHFSDRRLFEEFFRLHSLSPELHFPVLRLIDKREKIPHEHFLSELQALLGPSTSQALLSVLHCSSLKELQTLFPSMSFLEELGEIYKILQPLGLDSFVSFRPSITRGLDYYTSLVFETFLEKELGSICSGGAYDQLIPANAQENFSGIGCSFGIDRLLESSFLEKLGPKTSVRVLIGLLEKTYLQQYFSLLDFFLTHSIEAFLYPQEKKLFKQLEYAQNAGFDYFVFYGEKEHTQGLLSIRHLHTKQISELSKEDFLLLLQENLSLPSSM